MRVLLIFLLFLSTALAITESPRDTFRTYLKSMVQIKNNQGDLDENYSKAISTLDLSHIEDNLKEDIGRKYAQQLIKVLDKIKRVDYEKIPTNLEASIWYFDKRIHNNHFLEISLIKKKEQWLFSKETLDSLETYQKALKSKKTIEGVKAFTTITDKIRNYLPASIQNSFLGYETWQWVGLFFILIIAFIIEKICKAIITTILNHTSKVVKSSSTEMLASAIRPLAKIIFVFVLMKLIYFLDLDTKTHAVLNRLLYICLSLMTVWFAHKVIQFFSNYFKNKADFTETKFDDILVPLLTKTAFVVIYLFGALLVANSLTIDVTGIIAGLGIGGLAFAFAAKDTLANFFGSIMLVLDRPFDIGDIIVTGDIEGIVDEVGFRSTRIRTFNDSLITISNGELMNRPIDNIGKRRYRRLNTTLGLEYNTPPQKIEAFCEGIRQLILSYKWTRKDNFHVYFVNYGASALEIKVIVYWQTDEYSRELSEKHRLMIDILRLSQEIGVSFAFPTQTVHLFNEEKQAITNIEKEYLEKGIETAKSVIGKPISLRNPRSNSEDQEQFGKNDIGL
ncbi:MAG: mechanosensitive ion channel protein MscS [Halobacteriovoraceae bacterium]|nr:mechanosensitive ion channel protein MscS [Halobacteriovoraceae bacterium]